MDTGRTNTYAGILMMAAFDALSPTPQGVGLSVLKEQLAAKRSASCSTANRPYLVGQKKKTITVYRPDCKMWSCPYCGRLKAAHLVHVIAYGVHVYKAVSPGRKWSFMTLTARGDRRGSTKSLEDFQRGWPKLRKRITRQYGPFHYAAVPEPHADGTMHMHMLIEVRFDDAKKYTGKDGKTYWKSRWLARAATACGLGWRHDCQPVDTETGAAKYIAKYAAKQVANEHFGKGIQHYRTSNHWPRHNDGHVDRDNGYKWMTVKPEYLWNVLDLYKRAGFDIVRQEREIGEDG